MTPKQKPKKIVKAADPESAQKKAKKEPAVLVCSGCGVTLPVDVQDRCYTCGSIL